MENGNINQTPPVSPVTQQSSPASPTTPNTEKKLINLLVLLAIIIIIGVAGYILGVKTQSTITPIPTPLVIVQPTPTPDPTANWKTYINTEDNYSLLYPPDWTLDTTTLEIIPPTEGLGGEGRIFINVNASDGSLEQFMEATNPSTGTKNSQVYTLVKQIQINGVNGILTKGGCCGFGGQHVFVQHNNKTYHLTLKGPVDNPKSDYQTVFDQILSTFKFTD
ncbi:MAG: PsbP-related protein [Candidatus Gottesmanbacteria bacterium]